MYQSTCAMLSSTGARSQLLAKVSRHGLAKIRHCPLDRRCARARRCTVAGQTAKHEHSRPWEQMLHGGLLKIQSRHSSERSRMIRPPPPGNQADIETRTPDSSAPGGPLRVTVNDGDRSKLGACDTALTETAFQLPPDAHRRTSPDTPSETLPSRPRTRVS